MAERGGFAASGWVLAGSAQSCACGVGAADGPCASCGAELPRREPQLWTFAGPFFLLGRVGLARGCGIIYGAAGGIFSAAWALQRTTGHYCRIADRGADAS